MNIDDQDMSSPSVEAPPIVLEDLMGEAKQRFVFRKFTFFGAGIVSIAFFLLVAWLACKAVTFFEETYTQMGIPKEQVAAEQIVNKPTSEKAKLAATAEVKGKAVVTEKIKDEEVIDAQQAKVDGLNGLMTHYLILIALIAAVATTIGVGVMKFAFTNPDASKGSENIPGVVSPTGIAIAEFLKAITDQIKK